MVDKKPRKCLSVPQAVYLRSPRLSAPAAFIRTVSLFHAHRTLSAPQAVYPRRNPFPHNPRLSAPQAVAFSRFSGK